MANPGSHGDPPPTGSNIAFLGFLSYSDNTEKESKMQTVSTVEFMRHFGRYHDEAKKSPITLTKHGRPSVVVIPVELYEKLKGHADPRRVYGAGEMPEELAEMFLKQLAEDSADHQASVDD